MVSVAVGLMVAVAYYFSSVRFQIWLSSRGGRGLAYLSVAGFFGRLMLVGIIFYGLTLWNMINMVVTSITFVIAFTVFSGIFIYRLMSGGDSSGPTVQLLH